MSCYCNMNINAILPMKIIYNYAPIGLSITCEIKLFPHCRLEAFIVIENVNYNCFSSPNFSALDALDINSI